MAFFNYDFDLDRIVTDIKKHKAKKVCLQFPDGLKPKATEIADQLAKRVDVDILIWLGSNFGACDVPMQLERLNFDLIVNFGHAPLK
jgi:2-(3-amino-3-carboxypropyl)histidine synthase